MNEHYYIEQNGKKTYFNGEGKPPIFVQKILDDEYISDIDFFHITDGYLDWNQDNDDLVTMPLVDFLVQWGDKMIFAFDDRMAQLLFEIDTKTIAEKAYKKKDCFSEDIFLYQRCAALINGKTYYNSIRNLKRKLNIDSAFEAILYIPSKAWAKLHNRPIEEYFEVHKTPVSYETYSNKKGWQAIT